MNQISALNKPLRVDMPLNEPSLNYWYLIGNSNRQKYLEY